MGELHQSEIRQLTVNVGQSNFHKTPQPEVMILLSRYSIVNLTPQPMHFR